MKITIIYGQAHKGNTYNVTERLLKSLDYQEDDITRFFINNIPNCVGCTKCIMKGEEFCPHFEYIDPLVKSMDRADVLIISTPNYCMEMSGQMKTFFDHLAYRWISHRPNGSMKQKIGIAISTAAGAGAKKVIKSIKRQLFWLSVGKIYQLPFVIKAYKLDEANVARLNKLKTKTDKLAIRINNADNVNPSLTSKIAFNIMGKMQKNNRWNKLEINHWRKNRWID